MHDSNEVATAMLMFSRSGNTDRLVEIISDNWVYRKSKIELKT